MTLAHHCRLTKISDIPAHRRCLYPKPRVPKCYLLPPPYSRVAQRAREAEAFLGNSEVMDLILKQHFETIHEEEQKIQIEEVKMKKTVTYTYNCITCSWVPI